MIKIVMMICIYITGEGEWKLTLAYPGLTATMRYPLMLQAFIVVVHIVPEARLHRPRGEFLKNVQFPKIYVRKNTFERVWNFWQLVARFFKRATRHRSCTSNRKRTVPLSHSLLLTFAVLSFFTCSRRGAGHRSSRSFENKDTCDSKELEGRNLLRLIYFLYRFEKNYKKLM